MYVALGCGSVSEKMSRTSVTVPESLLQWFQSYCRKQKRSVSAQISFMIEQLKESEKPDNDRDRA
jgi:metal-responsive CopG/Arc/MetJ family transcriptional regulator